MNRFVVCLTMLFVILGNADAKVAELINPKVVGETSKRIVLKKNGRAEEYEGENMLTQSMFLIEEKVINKVRRVPNVNSVFVIKYDFTLSEDITIPENCTLEFAGGSISGSYKLTGVGTKLIASREKVFDSNVELCGSWIVSEAFPEWFGAKGDGMSNDTKALSNAAEMKSVLTLSSGKTYYISKTVNVYNSVNGNDAKVKAILPVISEKWSHIPAFYFHRSNGFFVKNLHVESNFGGVFVYGCKNFSISNYSFSNNRNNYKGAKFAISLSGSGDVYCENFTIDSVRFNSDVDAINTDGLHICGGVRNGKVKNLAGTTGDDFIALNVVEGGADKPIKEIDNISFDACEMNNSCSLGLRIYSYDNLPIKNVFFYNCKFQVSRNSHVNETPCVRIMTTVVFEQEKNDTHRVKLSNLKFENCHFSVSSGSVPKIIIQDTDGDVKFERCNWTGDKGSADIALHNNNLNLSVHHCHLTRGVQGWQWNSGNGGDSQVIVQNCDYY